MFEFGCETSAAAITGKLDHRSRQVYDNDIQPTNI